MAGRVPTFREIKKKNDSFPYLKKAKTACVKKDYAGAYENFVLYFESLNEPSDSSIAVQKIFTKLVCTMGPILEETNNIEELLKCYIQALNLFPDNHVILCNLGVHLFKKGEIDIARKYLERSFNVNKNYLPAEVNLMHVKWHQIPRWHFRMLNDKRRNIAYEKAISSQVNAGYKNVLDIGAGCGILSLFAARHAGTKVTAIEENKQLANICKEVMKANDFSNVDVLQSYSTDISEPLDKCNLLVTEVFDVAFFGEQAMHTIAHASAVLRTEDDYKIIPCSAKVYVSGISSAEIHSKHRCVNDKLKERLNMQNLEITVEDLEPYEAENLSDLDVSYLTDHKVIFDIDFYEPTQVVLLNENQKAQLKCKKEGILHALVVWFDLGLTPDISLTTDPLNADRVTCWEQAVFHLDEPVHLNIGDIVDLDVSMRNSRLNVSLSKDKVQQNSRKFKVSKEVLSFLNDNGLVESIAELAERFGVTNWTIVDYNVFPLLGLLMAKMNCTVVHSVKKECDKVFLEQLLLLNNISKREFIMLDDFVLETTPKKCLFLLDVISQDGLLESSGFGMMRPTGELINIPQTIIVHVQLVNSPFIDRSNLVKDENVLGFKIAEFINDYSGCEHPNLEKLIYTEHSAPVKFRLESDGKGTSRITVNKEGFVNALYVWYEIQLHRDISFSTKNSTFYKKACFFLKEHIKVNLGECLNVSLQVDQSYLKVYLEDK